MQATVVAAYQGAVRDLPSGLDVLARKGAQVLAYGWRRTAQVLGAPERVVQDPAGEWYAEWTVRDARVISPVKGEDLDTLLEIWPGVEVLTAVE